MKKIKNLLLAILLIMPCFVFSACDKNIQPESGYAGRWSGNTVIPKEQIIYCEEYETLDGQYLGNRISSSSHKMFLVNNVSKDLVLTYSGLVERSTCLYLGTEYDISFVLKDISSGDILYTSEEVSFYPSRACFDKETNNFLGLYTTYYEKSYSEYIYVINGNNYSSNDINRYNYVYVNNLTNQYLGVYSDFDCVDTYIIDGVEYSADEIYVLNSMSSTANHNDWFGGTSGYAYVENITNYCFAENEVVETYGYNYGETRVEVSNEEVQQIARNCIGKETTTIDANFGDYYAEITVTVDLRYNYDEIKDYTFTSADRRTKYSYKGHYGVLDGIIYFTADMYHNGSRWIHYEEVNRKFMFELKGNKLLFTDDSPEFIEYKDVTLTK